MTFLNLTNGLEFSGEFDGFIRIQSTHLEQKLFSRVIEELDYNFLIHLVSGVTCKVVDYSPKKDMSRALYQGMPWVYYCLMRHNNRPWVPYVNGHNVEDYFFKEYNKLSPAAIKKLDYVSKFATNRQFILQYSCSRTANDGDVSFYKERLTRLLQV